MQTDRAAPLPRPCRAARDVVLIAGKGHEDYQETAGVRQPFSDMAGAAALQRRGGNDMMTLQKAGAAQRIPAPAWWATAPRRWRACTPTRARCSRATCSWP
jgi:hypothetical protein